jgi:hypothetical protein
MFLLIMMNILTHAIDEQRIKFSVLRSVFSGIASYGAKSLVSALDKLVPDTYYIGWGKAGCLSYNHSRKLLL